MKNIERKHLYLHFSFNCLRLLYNIFNSFLILLYTIIFERSMRISKLMDPCLFGIYKMIQI